MVPTLTGVRPATQPAPGAPSRWASAVAAGRPLTWLLVGYPLWWLLGVAQILSLVVAVILAHDLLRRREPTRTPPGMGWWLCFVAWVLLGALVVQVQAPGALGGFEASRYLTLGFRVAWYVAATAVLLFIFNRSREYPTVRVVRDFAALFVTVVAGGVLGTLAPNLDFPSLLELMLPQRIATIPFAQDLIHPVVAQRYTVDGVFNPRASAPFAYTNGWALNFGLLLPFFIKGWLGRGAGWRRRVAPVVLLAAAGVAIFSLNRALWLALLAALALLLVRLAMSGRGRMVLVVGALVVLVGGIGAMSPLATTIIGRFETGYSNASRANLGTSTAESVLSTSPIVGFGTTRPVQGSFYSIAGGDSDACDTCSPPAFGTQGHLWLLLFSNGVVGLLLYLGFLLRLPFSRWRDPSSAVTIALTVVLVHLVTMPFYDTVGAPLLPIAAGLALAWRTPREGPGVDPPVRDLRWFTIFGRAHSRTIGVVGTVGVIVGLAWAVAQGPTYRATVSVHLPSEPTYPDVVNRSETLDTLAQKATSTDVLGAMSEATGQPVDAADMVVTATANTRVMHITYEGDNPGQVTRAASAGAEELLQVRTGDLTGRRDRLLDVLSTRERQLRSAIRALDESLGSPVDQRRTLTEIALTVKANQVGADMSSVRSTRLDPGQVVASAQASQSLDRWTLGVVSGGAFGLLVGMVLTGWTRDRTLARAASRMVKPLPVLTTLSRDRGETEAEFADRLWARLQPHEVDVVIAAGSDSASRRLAGMLDARVTVPSLRERPRVALAAVDGHPLDLASSCERLEMQGIRPVGVVLAGTKR